MPKSITPETHHDPALLTAVLDATNDIVFIKDVAGRYIMMNRAGAEMLGRPAAELVGLDGVGMFPGEPPERQAQVLADDERAMSLPPGQSVRFAETVITPQGRRHYLTTKSAYRDATGRLLGLIGVARDVTELVEKNEALERAKAAAEASEAQLRELADMMPQIVWTARPDGRLDYYNRQWYEVADPSRELDGDESRLPAVHPDDRAKAAAQWAAAVRTGEPMTANELRLRDARSGTYRWYLGRATPIRDASGALVRWIGTITDIHDRKATEDAALEGERRQRAFFEALPSIAWVNRADGSVECFNHLWTQYTGLDPRPAGLEWTAAIHPDDLATTLTTRAAAIARGEGYEVAMRFRRASDGAYRWHQCRVVPLLDGSGRFAWLGTAADVDDLRRAEEAVRANERKLRLTLEGARVGVWHWEVTTDQIEWSPEIHAMLGTDPAAVSLRYADWIAQLHPEDRSGAEAAWRDAVAARASEFRHEFRIMHPTLGLRWIDDVGRIEYGPEGAPVRLDGVNIDVTERKLAAQALAAAREEAERANHAKDDFLAALSHELRTPLSPVLMMSQMLERDPSLPDKVRASMRMIRRNVEIETRLIDDMLDLTRVARGKIVLQREVVDVHDLLRHAADTCHDDTFRKKRLQLGWDLRATAHWTNGDVARLGQIFWNLLKNATKFTPAGGTITLRTVDAAPGRLSVSVADTGLGIEPSLLRHVFNAFEQGGPDVTRQFGGLGLGLAICKSLTELHGGTITAHSDGPGRGATFVVDLSTVDPPARPDAGPDDKGSAREAREGQRSATGGGARLLLVEDHQQTAEVLERLLVMSGHEVQWVTGQKDALAAAAARQFDLVISDIGLADGDGNTLMRELRDRHGLRGIALSGYGMEQDVARGRESGFVEHIVKPVNIEQLELALGRHLRR